MDNIRAQITTAKNLLILGFGREGQSTYIFIRAFDPVRVLTIADASEQVRTNELLKNDPNVRFITFAVSKTLFSALFNRPPISDRPSQSRAFLRDQSIF